jgi:hypothetical protein
MNLIAGGSLEQQVGGQQESATGEADNTVECGEEVVGETG